MCETLHGIKPKNSMSSKDGKMEVVSRAFI